MYDLDDLSDVVGMPVDELLEEATYDSVAWGICVNCGYTMEVEPDCDNGYCEECEENTIKSCLVLAGII